MGWVYKTDKDNEQVEQQKHDSEQRYKQQIGQYNKKLEEYQQQVGGVMD